MNIYTLNVDIKRDMTSVVPTFAQGDSVTLYFRVFDNGERFEFGSYLRSEIRHKLPSGRIVVGNGELVTENGMNLIKYVYNGMEMAEIGFVETNLIVHTYSTKLSTRAFHVHIYENLHKETTGYIEYLLEMIRQLELLQVGVFDGLDNFYGRGTYDSDTQYQKNNIVEYNGKSYIAKKDSLNITPPTQPITFNDHWTLLVDSGGTNNGTVTSINNIHPDGLGNITLPVATIRKEGLMSPNSLVKLNGIATGANFIYVEDSFNSTSNEDALSANKGKEINDRLTTVEENIDSKWESFEF